jgi:hypothetical protein
MQLSAFLKQIVAVEPVWSTELLGKSLLFQKSSLSTGCKEKERSPLSSETKPVFKHFLRARSRKRHFFFSFYFRKFLFCFAKKLNLHKCITLLSKPPNVKVKEKNQWG